jgi:hypothetical protein
MTESVRKSISATLTEIEQSEIRKRLVGVAVINEPDEKILIGPDTDADEAMEILERIERKLFPAGMPH